MGTYLSKDRILRGKIKFNFQMNFILSSLVLLTVTALESRTAEFSQKDFRVSFVNNYLIIFILILCILIRAEKEPITCPIVTLNFIFTSALKVMFMMHNS